MGDKPDPAAAAPVGEGKQARGDSWAEIDDLWEDVAAEDAWSESAGDQTPAASPPPNVWSEAEDDTTPTSLSRSDSWEESQTPLAPTTPAADAAEETAAQPTASKESEQPAASLASASETASVDATAADEQPLADKKLRKRTRARSKGKRQPSGESAPVEQPASSVSRTKRKTQKLPRTDARISRQRDEATRPWLWPLVVVVLALLLFLLLLVASR